MVSPAAPAGFGGAVETVTADLSAPGEAERLAALRADVVFHLAAIVSGEAEADFDKGYRINLDGTRYLFEAIRQEGLRQPYRPRIVFTSSIAVFGAPFPDRIHDEFFLTPADQLRHPEGDRGAAARRLFAARLLRRHRDPPADHLRAARKAQPRRLGDSSPTSCASRSSAGRPCCRCRRTCATGSRAPRAAVGFLLHAATLDTSGLGGRRTLSLPGLSATVAEEIEALRRAAGDSAVRLIRHAPDPTIARIVEGWARDFNTSRAEALGFRAESSMDEIVRAHVEDELGGRVGG